MAASETQAQEQAAPPAVRVVVVDDSAAFRTVAQAVVERTPGFQLAAAVCSGVEALDAARRLLPDLMLIDVRMPGMGGVEAACAIAGEHPGMRVVLTSCCDRHDAPGASLVPLPFLCKSGLTPDALARLAGG